MKRYKGGSVGESAGKTTVRHDEPKSHDRSSNILPDIFPSTKAWDRGNNPARQQLLREKLREERKLKEKLCLQDPITGSGVSRDAETKVTGAAPVHIMKPPRARALCASPRKVEESIDIQYLKTMAEPIDHSGAGSEGPTVDVTEGLKGMAHARLATPARQSVKTHQIKSGSMAADDTQKARGSQSSAAYPQDWSLKTSAHFLSSASFDWNLHLR
eukprot:TRINITY_DN3499_c0_g1_i1.p1 TRINITY_DN3499_c0_g1~~TRINITY_DN3499_c0_g1_i1.p1  ORF type:complete len:215 (-),score=36.29 TRINITY_DN3499_c0_g1_i1:4-648(-)